MNGFNFQIFKIVLIFVFLIICSNSKAQPTLDTINHCLKQSPQLFGKLDSHNSFISNSRAKVLGVKFGFNYGNRLYFGIGYNQLYPSSKNFDKEVYYTNSNYLRDSTSASLQLFYFSAH